jgi:hypothetical protein
LRLLPGYIFFLLSALPLPAQTAGWWYPLGNPEATRRAGAMLPASPVQDSTSLLVKWRSTKLRNSPVLLVGAIRDEAAGAQQVVGMERGSNVLTILSSGGRLLDFFTYSEIIPSSEYSLSLTGLFNTEAPSPVAVGSPNVIGLGVERTQSTDSRDRLFGLLVDSAGQPNRYLTIDRLEEDPRPENRTAGVYPVAAFKRDGFSRAVAIVSQNGYDGTAPGSDTMVNSVRRYKLPVGITSASLDWMVPFAPKSYEQHPGMLDTGAASGIYLAPSHSTYRFEPARKVTPPTSGGQTETSSNTFYSFNLRADESGPSVVQTVRVPRVEIVPGVVHGRGDSYFAKVFASSTDNVGRWLLISTENHTPQDTGTARVFVYDATTSQASIGSYFNSDIRDIGWSIVAADVDGSDNSEPREPDLIPNKGDEIVGALRRSDGSDIDTNRLYLFRWNFPVPQGIGQEFSFHMFASFPFSGRLMASGDLVSDPQGRQEIIVANGNTLRILQLRAYSDPAFSTQPLSRKPFRIVDEITFDSRIVSAVIADLEGDGLNDIVVTTDSATYAIGRPPALPFGLVTVSDTVCVSEPASIRWHRRAGDGEEGTRIILRGASRDTTIDLASNSGDSLTIAPGALQPGRYRVIIQDPLLPALVDSSRTITVRAQSIGSLGIVPTEGIVGSTVEITNVPVSCAEGFQLQYSYDQTAWTRAAGGPSQNGAYVSATTTLVCPPQVACGLADRLMVYFRLVDASGVITSPVDSILLRIPPIPINVTPGVESVTRKRRITWEKTDFSCPTLRISLEAPGVATWSQTVDRIGGQYDLDVPVQFSGEITLRICCDKPAQACEYGKATILTEEADESNYIAPNPFDPERDPDGARILYSLTKAGSVTVTIYDASRAIVRRLLQTEEQEPGFHGELFWDGRNERREIVANGTYICVIESDSGARILLHMIGVKH